MRSTWRATGLVALGVLAGCTGGARGTATPGHSPAGPATPSASAAATAARPVLDCGDSIGGNPPPAGFQVVLGVVALPASPRYPALGTAPTGEGNGPLRLFAKSGLLVRPGAAFDLSVPEPFAGRLRIGWGSPGTPSRQLLVDRCANQGGGWLAFAGGYWIDRPACAALTVRVGDKQQQVRVGIGAACPGQGPPPGPTQR